MRVIKLKYNDTYIDNITPGTNLYEISRLVIKDFEFPIVGARLNNLDVDLSTIVTENGSVEFFDRSSNPGNKIYGRSLEFLVIAAAKEVFSKESDVYINYSLDNGIYCEVSDQKLTKNMVEQLEDKMREFVSDALQINLCKVSRLDAIKYFKRNHQIDKVKNLNYTSNSTIDLHRLKDTYDYFFGPLAYDTSQIDKFRLTYLNQNSFIVSYPDIKNPGVVLPYKHHEKIFNKYQEYKTWGNLVDINTVSDLNEIGGRGHYLDAISLFEAHYESELSSAAEKIYKDRKNIKIILLSGPSSSGKTTTTKKLALYLKAKGINPHLLSLDDYFVDRNKTPKDENGDYDFANIKSTNVSLFNEHLKKLYQGEKINLPKYDFVSGKQVFTNEYLQLEEDDVLLVEGIHTLNDKLTHNIPRENKFKIYITPVVQLKIDNHNRVRTTDLRKLRRIVRDNRFRGYSAEETLLIWHNVDKEAYENIYPYQDDVDLVINSSLSYEIGVLRIFAEPLLYGIDPKSSVYPEALRLINLLRQFMPISSETVPKSSVLREFIGEGIFNN
ncbi:MAG: nucleoside kinase [Bacilli bacterium]|nr:nucleoside kinase [Bacilli bacterium]